MTPEIKSISTDGIQANTVAGNSQKDFMKTAKAEQSSTNFVPDFETPRMIALKDKLKAHDISVPNDLVSPALQDLVVNPNLFENGRTLDLNLKFSNVAELIQFTQGLDLTKVTLKNTIPELNRIQISGDIISINTELLKSGNNQILSIAEVAQMKIDELQSVTDVELNSIPNDPDWYRQWGPQKIGADKAWDLITGTPIKPIVVAVIDTGIDYTHPDISPIYKTGGYDFYHNTNDPMDDHGHGTHVAGIIAAKINNNLGIAGVAGQGSTYVQVMAEKFLSSGGFGSDTDGAKAIIHAVDNGADILSNSWGGPPSDIIKDAVDYALSKGVIVVAAAGNGFGPDADSHYPGAIPGVITVSSTDQSDGLSYFSSYGKSVDVAAPGSDIYSTLLHNTYGSKSGTSMATPHVSGLIALMLVKQNDLNKEEINYLLRTTSKDLGTKGFDEKFGYGRIDALNSVSSAKRPTNDLIALMDPVIDASALSPIIIRGSVLNFGTTTESNLIVRLFENGKVVKQKTIPSLSTGSIYSVNYTLISTGGGTFNYTLTVDPVTGEINTNNNNNSMIFDLPTSTYEYSATSTTWSDASSGATNFTLGSGGFGPIKLPFVFDLYGYKSDIMFMSPSGALSPVYDPVFVSSYESVKFPTNRYPYIIAPFFDPTFYISYRDINTTHFSFKSYKDHVIFQWKDLRSFNVAGLVSFQVVLNNKNEIVFNYLSATQSRSTSIGLNKGAGSNDALEISKDSFNFLSNTSIKFTKISTKIAENEIGVHPVKTPSAYKLVNSNSTFKFMILNFGLKNATSVSYSLSINKTIVLTGTTDVQAGRGVIVQYQWNASVKGIHNFNFSTTKYLNETNLANNFYEFSIKALQSRLNVPLNKKIWFSLNGVIGRQGGIFANYSFEFKSTIDPIYVEFRLIGNILNSSFSFTNTYLFNILTFKTDFGSIFPFAIPDGEGIGWTNDYTTIDKAGSYNYQGSIRSTWEGISPYGGVYSIYDQLTGLLLEQGVSTNYTYGGSPNKVYAIYGPGVLPVPTDNLHMNLWGSNAGINTTTNYYFIVTNTGSRSSPITTLDVKVNSELTTIQVPSIKAGGTLIMVFKYRATTLSSFLLTGNLAKVGSETFLDDNFVSGFVRVVKRILLISSSYSYNFESALRRDSNVEIVRINPFDPTSSVDITEFSEIYLLRPNFYYGTPNLNFSKYNSDLLKVAENGGSIKYVINEGSGYYNSTKPNLITLVGGLVYNQYVTPHPVRILEPNAKLFFTPNRVSVTPFDNPTGYFSGYGTNDYLLVGDQNQFSEISVLAKKIGSGYIMYLSTSLLYSSSYESQQVIENLVDYTPEFTPQDFFKGPKVIGPTHIAVLNGSTQTIVLSLSSFAPKSIQISGNLTSPKKMSWDNTEFTYLTQISPKKVGIFVLKLIATDDFGKSTVHETIVEVLPNFPKPTSPSAGGGFIPISPLPVFLAFVAVAWIVRKKLRK